LSAQRRQIGIAAKDWMREKRPYQPITYPREPPRAALPGAAIQILGLVRERHVEKREYTNHQCHDGQKDDQQICFVRKVERIHMEGD